MNTHIRNRFTAFKVEELRQKVRYYQNGNFPELKEHTGCTQAELLEMAEKALRNFDRESWQPTKQEKANYLRRIAIETREDADAFKDSDACAKWGALRVCVYCIQELRKLYPELNIYTNHWLSLAKPIKLNNL